MQAVRRFIFNIPPAGTVTECGIPNHPLSALKAKEAIRLSLERQKPSPRNQERHRNFYQLFEERNAPQPVSLKSGSFWHGVAGETGLRSGLLLGGRYFIVNGQNKGGFGVVFRAVDVALQTLVALKVPFKKGEVSREIAKKALEKEEKLLSSLDHPSIIKCFGHVAVDEKLKALVLEFIEEGLDKNLTTLSAPEIVNMTLKICEAVAVLHEKGIVHGDLKPANILLRPSGEPVLVDFGVSRSIGEKAQEAGTRVYMDPLCVSSGVTSDIYSVGVILYELMTKGITPFQSIDENGIALYDSTPEIENRIFEWKLRTEELWKINDLKKFPKATATFSPQALEEIMSIILKCMSMDLEKRYQSMSELIADLRALQQTKILLASESEQTHL